MTKTKENNSLSLNINALDALTFIYYGLTCSSQWSMTLYWGVSNIIHMHESVVTKIIIQSRYVTKPNSLLQQKGTFSLKFVWKNLRNINGDFGFSWLKIILRLYRDTYCICLYFDLISLPLMGSRFTCLYWAFTRIRHIFLNLLSRPTVNNGVSK